MCGLLRLLSKSVLAALMPVVASSSASLLNRLLTAAHSGGLCEQDGSGEVGFNDKGIVGVSKPARAGTKSNHGQVVACDACGGAVEGRAERRSKSGSPGVRNGRGGDTGESEVRAINNVAIALAVERTPGDDAGA